MHSAVHRYWGPSVEKASLRLPENVFGFFFWFFFTTCCLTFSISVCVFVQRVGVSLCRRRRQEQQQMRVWSSLQTRSRGSKEDIILCVYECPVLFRGHQFDTGFVLSQQSSGLSTSVALLPQHHSSAIIHSYFLTAREAQVRIWTSSFESISIQTFGELSGPSKAD